MNIKEFMDISGEKPLDRLVTGGGFCGIFRTIACIGDSLSSGELESLLDGEKGFHDYYEYSWGQYLARDAGCTVYNFSKGGMTAKKYDAFAREQGFYDEKYLAQAYILALGVNDINKVREGLEPNLGTLDDIDPTDPDCNKQTFVGQYAAILARYQAMQPKAKFFLVTCPRSSDASEDRNALCDIHRELLYALSERFENCYVLDLREYAPLYDEEFRRHFYLAGHMNAQGYRLTALMIESYIDYLIRHNPEDFKQVGFIGTPYHNENEKW